ncbi:MFS transporter [Saccharopolyspora shandongensis]|uniref:MFS transporter n=1 Tax=Saccharopolyspora shandongensis TaxID=418495 RepID=UPI0033F2D43C
MSSDSIDPAVPPAGMSARSGRWRWVALVVLAAAVALDAMGVAIVNTALPAIGREMGMNTATLPLVMTVYAATFAGFLLLGGRAGDVLGHRRVFLVGMAVYALAVLTATLASAASVLLVARAVQGLGAAISGPPALALLAAVFTEPRERARAMGVYAAVAASSFAGGLVLGGVLTSFWGWRSAFGVLVPVAVAVVVVGSRLLPGQRAARERSLDLPGAGLITAGLVFAVYGVSQAEHAGFGSPFVLALVIIGVGLMVGFGLREHYAQVPLLPLKLFRARPVRAATVAGLVFYTAVNGLLFFAPLYMQGILGYSALQSGLAILPMGLTVIVASQVAGRLMPKVGLRSLMTAGLMLVALGVGTWTLIGPDTDYFFGLLPGILIVSVGQGLAFTAMTAASLAAVEPKHHGVAGGLNITCQQVGAGLGVAIIATIAAAVQGTSMLTPDVLAGYHAATAAAAGVGFLGALAVFFLLRHGLGHNDKSSTPQDSKTEGARRSH